MHGARLVCHAAVEGLRIIWWTCLYLLRYLAGPRNRERLAGLLRAYLLRMGPLYVKAGQVLGTQSGVLTERAADEFRHFFSDLPPMRPAALHRVLRRGLGAPVGEVFAAFEPRPLAVGSVAQIHLATSREGRRLAVKVVKSGTRERLAAASWVLARLAGALHALVPPLRKYDLPGHVTELRPALVGQCDMRAEALRQLEVAQNFRSHPFLRVPRVHEEFCREDILVMEYVEAVRGQDVARVGFPRDRLAERLQDVFYCMVYFHGLFHVDPHPGNIMFGADGQIILVDFGLVGRLSEEDRWNLSAFYYACLRHQWPLAVARFTRTFVVHPDRVAARWDDYEQDLAAVLRTHFAEISARWSTMSFLTDAIRLMHRYGTRLSTRFTLLALCLLTGEGFLSQVDPDIDIWRNARRFADRFSPYLSEELRARLDREFQARLPATLAARRQAAACLVAPTHLDRFAIPSAFPLIVAEARGSKLRDLDGNEYIDLSCGYGPHILGYAPECAVRAVQEAMAAGGVNAIGNPAELRLAELIAEAFGPGAKVVLANSGTEAVQMALRMARAFTGRPRVAKFEGHYHGFSEQGTVSSWFRYRGDRLAPQPIANSAGVQRAVVDETLVLQYGEPASLERIAAHGPSLACVIVEPMPAALGDFDAGFLRELAEVCAREGVLVIHDEVVTGFRVHYGGVRHLAGVTPDLTCLGKIIGGGLPCGAVVGRAEVVDMARTTGDPFLDVDTRAFVGGTMSGNSITAAAGAAVLAHLRDNPRIYDELRAKTAWLVQELASHAAEQGIPCVVTGRDSIFSLTFDHAAPRLVRDRLAGTNIKAAVALAHYMRRHGVYLPELHTMMLSAAHSDADLKAVSRAFRDSLADMTADGFFTT